MKAFSRFILGGLFLGLVCSQSLMDLFFGLATLLGLCFALTKKESNLISVLPNWIWLLLPWLGWIVVSFLTKAPTLNPFGKAIGDFLWIIQLPLLVLIWKSAEPTESISKYFLFILLGSSTYAVAIYVLGYDPLVQHWSDRAENLLGFWRTGGLFSNAMSLAQSFGPLAMTLLPLSIFTFIKNKSVKNWILLTFIITCFAVLFTFTRGVWLAMVASTLICSFIYSRRLGLVAVLSLALAGGILLTAWPKFRERTFQAFDPQKSYDSERLVLWKTNWLIFSENPVMGIGYGENKRRLREYYDRLNIPPNQFEGHAHNQYLHFLAGTGFVGLLFYLFWCGSMLKLNLNLYRHEKAVGLERTSLILLGLLMAQVAFHVGSLTESNFTISKNRMLLVFFWSYLLFYYSTVSGKLGQDATKKGAELSNSL